MSTALPNNMPCLAPDDQCRGGLCCHFERGCVSEACSSGHFEYDFGSETCSSGGGGVGSDPEPYIASHHPIRNHKKHKKKAASPLCMRTHAQSTLRKLCSSYFLIAVSTALMTLCVPRIISSQATLAPCSVHIPKLAVDQRLHNVKAQS